jgi:putative flippase GtrA
MIDSIRRWGLFSSHNPLGQFARSAVVGGIASAADVSVFSMGVYLLKINHILSNTLAFAAGLTINYYLSREWVFNRKVHKPRRDFLLFSIIGVIGLLLSNVFMYVMVDLGTLSLIFGSASDNLVKPAAKAAAIALVFIWNFTARKKVVFSS